MPYNLSTEIQNLVQKSSPTYVTLVQPVTQTNSLRKMGITFDPLCISGTPSFSSLLRITMRTKSLLQERYMA